LVYFCTVPPETYVCGSVDCPTTTSIVFGPTTEFTLKINPRFPLGYVTIPGPEGQVNPRPTILTASFFERLWLVAVIV